MSETLDLEGSSIGKVNTDENESDILTKALGAWKHWKFVTKLGLPPAAAMWTFCLMGAAILLGSVGAYAALVRIWPRCHYRQSTTSTEQKRSVDSIVL